MYQKKINDTAYSFQSHVVNLDISNYSTVLILSVPIVPRSIHLK